MSSGFRPSSVRCRPKCVLRRTEPGTAEFHLLCQRLYRVGIQAFGQELDVNVPIAPVKKPSDPSASPESMARSCGIRPLLNDLRCDKIAGIKVLTRGIAMRLTLRTLLAYLDDTLDPSEARMIGEKVAESEVGPS